MVPLYDFRLHAAKKVLLRKKCVYDIENKGEKYRNILHFDCCNEKWLKLYHFLKKLCYLEDVR